VVRRIYLAEHRTVYLGIILTYDCQFHVKQASAAFGHLSKRVFLNRNLTVNTKVVVFKAVCIPILLYSCESWTLYRQHVRALKSYDICCLQAILNIHWSAGGTKLLVSMYVVDVT